MADVIKTTFQVKRGTAARWEELNLILNPGEPGFEMDTFKLKIGNGSTPWKELPYVNDVDISKYITIEDIINGDVILPVATKTTRGAVLSSTDVNEISVDPADGSMEVNSLAFDKLQDTADVSLVLNGGDSTRLI